MRIVHFKQHILAMAIMFVLMQFTGIGMVTASSGEASFDDVKSETKDLMHTLKDYSVQQKDEAVDKARSTLQSLDRRIEVLEERAESKWDEMDAAAREQTRETLKTLRKQRVQVAEWLGSMKESSEGAWEHMKEGFSDAFQMLAESWEKAEQEF